jgi:SPP1 family predicted phage head-tail adaptor
MQSQQLDTVIQIERRTVTRGSSGGQVSTWAPHAALWAQRTDLSGTERRLTSQGGEAAVARTEFLVRERDDLTTTMRVVHKGLNFNIQHIKPLTSARGWMVLTCETGANDG